MLLILLIITAAGLVYFQNPKPKNFNITSPLPDLLTHAFPKVLGEENIWKPRDITIASSIKQPDLTAKSAAAYDITTNQYLYKKDVDTKRPIASLTKIMTAIIALENEDINKEFTVSHAAANIGEDSMGLSEGEKFALSDLLYGLVLNSGNDAAETIAQDSQFGRANFVYLMNKKAEDLALSGTHFTNPTGLQGDGNQYSTISDLLSITHYALQNSTFAKVAATYEYDIPESSTHKAYTLYNETNLLTTYPGVKGVKTGFTDEAGMCLVTYLEYDGHKIIAIVLNAENRREEMKELLDYSLKTEGITPPPHD